MDERGEPYTKRSRIDSTDEALSLNSSLPDELSLINCTVPSTTNPFPLQAVSLSYANNVFTATSNLSVAMTENPGTWMGSQKVIPDRVLPMDHNSSSNIQMPKSMNKINSRLQSNSPSFSYGNGPLSHQMNATFSPSPTLVDGLASTKVGLKRPFSATVQSNQPSTHMLPPVPMSGMNQVRVMSFSSTNKDSGGMFSTFSPLQVVSTRPTMPNANMLGDTIDMKKKLIQRQLVLLLHAHKCHRRELNNPTGKGPTPVKPCNLPQCSLMKDVLKHMSTCNEGKNCKVMHCSTSRQIISHWKNCSRPGCIICTPLRHCGDTNNNNNANTNNVNNFITAGATSMGFSNGASNNVLPSAKLGMLANTGQTNVIAIGSGGITPSATPKIGMKPWHASVTEDLRNHLVKKLVQAIMPLNENSSVLKHPQIKNLVNYAKKVEGDNFDKANSREEYYSLLAGKIYKIQKDLQAQKLKKEMEQKLQAEQIGRILPLNKVTGSNQSTTFIQLNSGGGFINSGGGFTDLLSPQMNLQDGVLSQTDSVPQPDLLGLSPACKGSFVNKSEPLSPSLMSHQNISMPPSIASSSSLSLSLLPDLNSLQVQAVDSKHTESKPAITCNLQQFKTELIFSPLASGIDSSTMSDSLFDAFSSAPSIGSTGSPLDCLRQFLPTSGGKLGDLDCNISLGSLVGSDVSLDSMFPASLSSSSNNVSSTIGDLLCGTSQQEGVTSSTCSPIFTPVSSSFATPFESVPAKREEEQVTVKKEVEDESDNGFSTQVKVREVKAEELKSIKEEVEVKEEPCDAGVRKPKVFTQEELYQAFLPSLDKMYKQEPDAIPFRQPVDSVRLGIPDYYNIIKNPMDLSTIRQKLESGQYIDPWQYIRDVHLMFENAWLYNRKTSKVYKACTKLCEIFQAEIDAPMRALGFCCGQKLVFTPQALCCYGKELCTITRESTYYHYDNKYTYCEKCFNDILKPEVEIEDSSQPGLKIRKSEFIREKNDKLEPELFVECVDCCRKLHKICVLHFEPVHSQKFFCNACLKSRNGKRKENRFTAKKLPNTKLGIYLESRVNQFLKKKDAGDVEVVIRVLSSLDKSVEVKSGMRQRFEDTISTTFPYRVKTIFAFTEIDGSDVCFFGMHVQEYGSDCPEPNSRRVYIAYLDSVNFFRPRFYRTAVYHEILVGYLEYVKSLGFMTAHIWACPPSEGDDYIFHCHPPDQKIPKPKKLQEWYKKMLDKAVEDRVIVEYKDILQDAQETQLSCVTGLPYFEGDFWPTILEESIAEEKQKMLPKREEEDDEADDFDSVLFDKDDCFPDSQNSNDKKKPHKNNNGKKRSVKNKKNSKSRSKTSLQQSGYDDLLYKLFSTMEKYKEVFFVIYLQDNMYPSMRHSPYSLPLIVDPDPIMNTDLMDGRDAFLTMCRERHLEFSSLRRAKYSSVAMLYELHIQMRESTVCCVCQNCKVSVETRYHCMICEDFDLCTTCYPLAQHPHRMIKIGLGLEDACPSTASPCSTSSPGDKSGLSADAHLKNGNANDSTKKPQLTAMQRYELALVHAASCRDANCHMGSCLRMKGLIAHLDKCRIKKRGAASCCICPQMKRLCLAHSRSCKEQNKCPVPACNIIRRKLETKRNKERVKHEQLTRRRIINMKIEEADVSPSSNTSKGASNGGLFSHSDENSMTSGQFFSQQTNAVAAAKPCPQPGAMAEMPVHQQREFPKTMTGGMDFSNYDSSISSPMTMSPHVQHLSPMAQQRVGPVNAAASTSMGGGLPPQKAHLQHFINLIRSNLKNQQSLPELARIFKSKPQYFAALLKMIRDKSYLKATVPSGTNGPGSSSAAVPSSEAGVIAQQTNEQKSQQVPMQFQAAQSNFQQASSQQMTHHQHQIQQQQQMQHQQQSQQLSQQPQQQQQQQIPQISTKIQIQQPHHIPPQSQLAMQQLQQAPSTQAMNPVMQQSQVIQQPSQHQQPQQVLQQKVLPQNQHHCVQQMQQISQQQHKQQHEQWFQQDQQMPGSVPFDPNLKAYQHHQLIDGDNNDTMKVFHDALAYNHFPNNAGVWDSSVPMKSVKASLSPYQQKQLQQQHLHQQFLHQQKTAIYSTQQGNDNMDNPTARNRPRMTHPYPVNMMAFRGANPGVQTSITFDNSCKDGTSVASLNSNSHPPFQPAPTVTFMGQVANNADITSNPQQHLQQQQQQQNMMRPSFAPQDPSYQGNMTTFPGHQILRSTGPNVAVRHPMPHQQHQQILNNSTFGYVSMDTIPNNNMSNQPYMQPAGQRFVRPQNAGGQGQIRMHRPQFNQMGMNPMPQGDYSYSGNYSFSQQANFQQVQHPQQLIHPQQQQMVEPGLICTPNQQHMNPIPQSGYSMQQSNQFQLGPSQLLESSDGSGHQMLPQP